MSDLSVEDFFMDRPASRDIFEAVLRQIHRLGDPEIRVSKSQIAFRRKKNFALVWIPGQYLKDRPMAPLVLTLSFPDRDPSTRWKEITQIGPKRFTHHLELKRGSDVDGEVFKWLQRAWHEDESYDRGEKRMETMIMPYKGNRDPRLVTERRGGTLKDTDHRLLAEWAASCAEHVLHFFEDAHPGDDRPRRAIEQARAWARGEIIMTQARTAAFAAHAAAREASGAAKEAARAAGHAVAVAHMADHELGAAAYAIRAVRAAADPEDRDAAGRAECQWQKQNLREEIRDLVLDDERLRNKKCWSLFF